MLGLATRLISDAISPLVDQASASSARLLRKLALFVVAGFALVVVLIALTLAFAFWVASQKGPIIGALAVAGLYFAVAAIAAGVALWPRRKPAPTREAAAAAKAREGRSEDIDQFAAPLLGLFERLGLRREQLAVLAGTSVAKQIGPVPLVGLAIVAGFLIGRMGRGLMSSELVASLLDLGAMLFGTREATREESSADDGETRDAA